MITAAQPLEAALQRLGLEVAHTTGQLSYRATFQPLALQFSLLFVRHGETFGNCGQITACGRIDTHAVQADVRDPNKRVFQGNVDTTINQLTRKGIAQSQTVAEQIEQLYVAKGFMPDVVLHSPLARALQTGLPFVDRNRLHDVYRPHPLAVEMSFGAWENKRLCDFDARDPCHSFYRAQNALVKSPFHPQAESFCEVILRACQFISDLNHHYAGKKVLLFSHSMFGAACAILLGKGKQVENGPYLAFDGRRQDGTSYALPHATPILLC